MTLSGVTLAALEYAANRYFEMSPDTRREMARLHGRVFRFELVGLGLRLHMIPCPHGVQILERVEGDPDCTLRGTPSALLGMGDPRESSARLFSGDVEISGDTELAHRLGKILGAMDIDWEEQLSHYTGDILAHQIGTQLRGTIGWGERTFQTVGADLSEYLREELELLPAKSEIESFVNDVDQMRDGVERLEARYRMLLDTLAAKKLQGRGSES